RFGVVGIDAIVADEWIGHGDDLALVRRVRQHLLITGHAGVKDHLAKRLAARTKTAARIDRAIFQGQFCQCIAHVLWSVAVAKAASLMLRVGVARYQPEASAR